MRGNLTLTSMLKRPLRILLLGAPGSGKGTMTTRLLNKFDNINTLSSGDILRSQILLKTDVGLKAQQYISQGGLVPSEIMVSLITNHMAGKSWLSPSINWLLDGFPRTKSQAESLDLVLAEKDCNLNLVVELNVDQKVILERIEARYIHAPSGRVYNLDYNPPKNPGVDDITGEPLTKRVDDTAEVFKSRLETYNKKLELLKQFYVDKGVFETVSGDTLDVIYPKLEKLILDRFG